jgi:hypothetical protein
VKKDANASFGRDSITSGTEMATIRAEDFELSGEAISKKMQLQSESNTTSNYSYFLDGKWLLLEK